MTTATTPSATRRRRPFAAIRKGLVEHVRDGRFNATQLGMYVWLHLLADHTTGTVRTNAAVLANELRIHPVTVRRHLAALRRAGYIRYASTRRAQLYEIAIEKYDRHFEDQARALHGSLRGPLHARAANAPGDDENRAPKKKEGRRTTPLRVRFADPDTPEDLSDRSETRAREDVSRADALAQAPAVMRETLELFLHKTGRETVTASELDALRAMETAHTPAVIQRAITRAVERLTQRDEPASTLTLDYIQRSLQHFTTRKGTGARREAVPQPSYPTGLTRLW